VPGQGRLGDKAAIQLDVHGCPACPHPGTGPAIQGSPDVNVNRRPALRVGDPGIHAACCGANTWSATVGSATVFINGQSAHRIGDMTRHCGGMGRLVEGSPNVIVGEDSAGGGGSGTRGGGNANASDGSGTGDGGIALSGRANAASSDPPVTPARAPVTRSSVGDLAVAPESDNTHYVEVEFADADGKPLPGVMYELTAPDGRIHKGTLDSSGKARVDRLPEGTCELTFTSIGRNPRSTA